MTRFIGIPLVACNLLTWILVKCWNRGGRCRSLRRQVLLLPGGLVVLRGLIGLALGSFLTTCLRSTKFLGISPSISPDRLWELLLVEAQILSRQLVRIFQVVMNWSLGLKDWLVFVSDQEMLAHAIPRSLPNIALRTLNLLVIGSTLSTWSRCLKG